MLDLVRNKALAAAVTAAGVVVALQIVLPTMLDAVVGFALIGLVWLIVRLGGRG